MKKKNRCGGRRYGKQSRRNRVAAPTSTPISGLPHRAARDRDAWNFQLRAAQFGEGGDEHGGPVVATEAQIGGMTPLANQDGAEMLALGTDDPNPARPGAVDVAFQVAFHTVGSA